MKLRYALYYSRYCFFCHKVLLFLRKWPNQDAIELRSTADKTYAQELAQGGGKTQVPCLRIESADGKVEWMYESDDIIHYLGSLA